MGGHITSSQEAETTSEQRYIDRAYERLHAMRQGASTFSESALELIGVGTEEALHNRDALLEHGLRRFKSLDIGDLPLVFGKIDTAEGENFYVGRVAVYDEEQHPLVVDWRAPAAEPFYRATPLEPMGVVRRRHFICRGSKLVRIEDEVFGEGLAAARADGMVLLGEGALLDELHKSRSGRMRDIVATIQKEQDEVIRSPIDRSLLVRGGPGTGKTVVALHRAAYLLYTHRGQLSRSGVLFVGPTPIFLRYVEDVLPSLGEESATLATPSGLLTGIKPTRSEERHLVRLKGESRMAAVVKASVHSHQRPLEREVTFLYETEILRINPNVAERVVSRVKRGPGTHNEKRGRLERALVDDLYRQYRRLLRLPEARRGRGGSLRDPEWRRLREFLSGKDEFKEALNEMWPRLTARSVIRDLLSNPDLLERAGEHLTASERKALQKGNERGWSEADVPLVDEAKALIEEKKERQKMGRSRSSQREEMIDQVLDEVDSVAGLDYGMREAARERLRAATSAEFEDPSQRSPLSVFGYVLVDEGQDLSPMQWRTVGRRATKGRMTVVGDLGQATAPTAADSWERALASAPLVQPVIRELSINYRTTAEIMQFAARLLPPGVDAPTSVREADGEIHLIAVESKDLATEVSVRAQQLKSIVGEGTVAVIAPSNLIGEVRSALGGVGGGAGALDEPITLITPREAKGLEFDAAVVVEPLSIIEEEQTPRALYVALTRPTRMLTLIHSRGLPDRLKNAEVLQPARGSEGQDQWQGPRA